MNSIASAVLAAVTGIVGAGIGAYATLASSEKARIESCIKRIDDQEQRTREKAEVLLGDIGHFIGVTATNDDSKMLEPGQKIIKSAFELTAYGPPELNLVSIHLAVVILEGLIAETPEQKIESVKNARTALNGWSPNYVKLMNEFEQSRLNCRQ
ncbi:hypothetical protein [Pseudomonas brassicacearum]|uniref:hypothetical protein n=1 Tax=Pseudomonas brassicacearum TaxID=930166 RepID=UPI001BDE3111|nr:hypothetical protein [Pseudomonas brassicacearum]